MLAHIHITLQDLYRDLRTRVCHMPVLLDDEAIVEVVRAGHVAFTRQLRGAVAGVDLVGHSVDGLHEERVEDRGGGHVFAGRGEGEPLCGGFAAPIDLGAFCDGARGEG